MKNLFFLSITGLFFFLSCHSKNQEEKKNVDDTIIEITPAGGSQSNNNVISGEKDTQVQLDVQFKLFLNKFKKVDLPYKIEPEEELDYEKIPFDLQVDYLSKAEGLDKSELEQMQDYAQFYYLSNPIATDEFNAIVYARSEMGSSYYILCTFNNSGKLISFVDFAMHQLIGAGPQAGQEYTMTGFIDKNWKVKTVYDKETKNYLILEDGKIVKK